MSFLLNIKGENEILKPIIFTKKAKSLFKHTSLKGLEVSEMRNLPKRPFN